MNIPSLPTFDHTERTKMMFHRKAVGFLRQLAEEKMGLSPADYNLRVSRGGPAVLGETILHTDKLYVQIGENYCGKPVMWRTCKSRNDYEGGRNCFGTLEQLVKEVSR